MIRELRQALLTIRYGAIELVIHDGRVVQLEWREKVHFERTKHGDRQQVHTGEAGPHSKG